MEVPILAPNTVVRGKWKGNTYKVIKMLGKGGIAGVYMVKDIKTEEYYAMKIGKDNISLNREYQLLQEFKGIDFIVNAYDIDDVVIKEDVWHYILLQYIPGMNLKDYLVGKKLSSIIALGLIILLLAEMKKIHIAGYILGDLKLENIMLNNNSKSIHLIDLGGVVKIGGTIKEYTPAYDRAMWKRGQRRGDISYDLFTIIMLLIQLILNKSLNPLKNRLEDVFLLLEKEDVSIELLDFLKEESQNQDIDYEKFAYRIKELYRIEGSKIKARKIIEKGKKIDTLFVASGIAFLITYLFLISAFLIGKI